MTVAPGEPDTSISLAVYCEAFLLHTFTGFQVMRYENPRRSDLVRYATTGPVLGIDGRLKPPIQNYIHNMLFQHLFIY